MLEQISPKAITLALFSALSLSQVVFAQDVKTTESEDEIIFTANRYATSANEIGSQSIVITSKEIQNRQYHTATEAFAHQPGVILSQNGINGPSFLYIRGANSQNTLVLVNGVPLGDAMGTGRVVDFSLLGSLLDVNRIEVLKGPQSSVYGSSAMGGVIQLFTNNLDEKGTKIRLMAGSDSTIQTSATTTGQVGNLRYSLGGLIENSHGIDATTDTAGKQAKDFDKDRYKNRQLSGRFNYLLTEELDVDFAFTYNKRYSEFDNSWNPTDFNNDNRSKLFTGRLALNGSFLEDQLTSTLAYSLMKLDRDSYSGTSWPVFGATHNRFNGKTQTVNFDNELSFYQNFKTRFGLAYQNEQGSGDNRLKHSQNTKSIYLEQSFDFADRFYNTAGIRYDKNSKFGSKTTYRFTSRYNFNEMVAVKGSFGTGFTAPNIYQIHDPSVGNKDLTAETSKGFDVGFEIKPTMDTQLSFSYFHTNYKNMIGWFEFNPHDPNDWRGEYRNFERAKIKGLEIVASTIINEQITLSGSYTYLDAKEKKQLGGYQQMQHRPRHQVTANVTYQPLHNLTLNTSAVYYGERKGAANKTLDSFVLFDIAGSYKINNRFEVDAKIQNLFNKDYNLIEGYRERGRSAYIGVNISL